MSFIDWLSTWKPEHVIALLTALGIGGLATKFKGTAKPEGAQAPVIDASGQIHSVKLESADRAALFDIRRDVIEVRKAQDRHDEHIDAVRRDIANIRGILNRRD